MVGLCHVTSSAKTYRELCLIYTFEERFRYLKIGGSIGRATFGFERYLNQALYQSREWQDVREKVLLRDDGCDLGIVGREIFARATVHHINPITIEDIELSNDCVFDLNNLITASHETHNAIHYGGESKFSHLPKERRKGDMCPWLKIVY
jgi:hypothetical protein